MAVNHVIKGGQTLIDLRSDTVTADKLARGITAHDAAGNIITGIMSGGNLPSVIKAFDAGDVVITTQISSSTPQTFSHNLGVVPDLMMVFATANVAQTYSMLYAIRGSAVAYRNANYNMYTAQHGNSTTTVTVTTNSTTAAGVYDLTATDFKLLPYSSTYYWRPGTYKYIALKFA